MDTITIAIKGRDMSVMWPTGVQHRFELSPDQSVHWVVNSLANHLQKVFKSGPAGNMQKGKRNSTLAALAKHLWDTGMFTRGDVSEALETTNNQFDEPLPKGCINIISKGACK
jgi:hypothetical protein